MLLLHFVQCLLIMLLLQFVQRLLIMLMPSKYQPDYMFLRHVPLRRVHLFTAIQLACFAGLCVIKEIEIISIVFPLMASSRCFRCIDAFTVM